MSHRRYMLLLLLLVAAACDDASGPHGPRIVSGTVAATAVPLTAALHLVLSEAAGVTVEYGTADGPVLVQQGDEALQEHEILLSRLRPGSTYEVRMLADGGTDAYHTSFQTEPLPADLQSIRFEATGRPTFPLTFLEIPRVGDFGTGYALIVDEEGAIVWWYPAAFVNGSVALGDGRFALVQSAGSTPGVRVVDAGGRTVAELVNDAAVGREAHHDVVLSPAGTLYVLSTDSQTVGDRAIVGEAVWEWDPTTGVAERRWSSFDHLSVAEWGVWSQDDDWLHANSLHVGARGNVLMSLRNLSQVISIAPDFQALEWRLGGIGSTELEESTDFVFGTEADRFVLEHTASLLSEAGDRSRVLLFDNGWGPRPYSRALELELDHGAGTARSVWEFQPEPPVYSAIVSSARRLDNGNTLVTFGSSEGTLDSSGPVEVFEVDPEGTPVWRLRLGGPAEEPWFILYRATPLATIAGEAVRP